ncbi:MAG: hypothetical protein L0I76_14860 [Pseudonocardia sp.]|nr:hypothetical protein [Pseudonocardia sp.]
MSAADAYKALVAELDAAATRLRETDRERAEELSRDLGDLDAALAASAERAALTRLGVALRWEAAVESLWQEHWLVLRPEPVATAGTRPEHLERMDQAVDEALTELRAEIRRRRLSLRR